MQHARATALAALQSEPRPLSAFYWNNELTAAGCKSRQSEHFILGLNNVIVHVLSSGLGIALFDGLQNVAMLAARRFPVVINVDGGKHDAFHLAARFAYGLHQHLIAR